MEPAENKKYKTIFPRGEKINNDYFSGMAWLEMLVPNDDIFNCPIGNVTFEPGVRNNWHKHPGGQILLATSGVGYFQEKDKPIQLFQAGEVIKILPDVVHWHGAAPNSQFSHLAISTNPQKGIVEWLQPVTDEEYNSYSQPGE